MEARKLPFAVSLPPGALDFTGAGLAQSGDLRAQGEAGIVPYSGADVRVHGQLQANLAFDCDRCLSRAELPLDLAFDLIYKPAAAIPLGEGEEKAIDESEAEMGFYEEPGLELEDVLREQVLFSLPMQRVCRPDCLGICPECGGNRNQHPCHCESHAVNESWGALKDLQIETK